MTRVTISSVGQFLTLAERHPAMLRIPSFNVIKNAITQSIPKNCGCSGKKADLLAQQRQFFESAISVLSAREQAELKTVLNADQVCYNKKAPNGQINLYCF
jgi:hypothetical protein